MRGQSWTRGSGRRGKEGREGGREGGGRGEGGGISIIGCSKVTLRRSKFCHEYINNMEHDSS